jgi:hypothetical protein
MVTVSGFSVQENKGGKTFIALELTGDLVMVQSQETGRFYATSKKCSITSTFTQEQAERLVGKEMPGRIERVSCDPYEFENPTTGELMQLSHRYEYVPEERSAPLRIIHSEVAA